jgi:hypothetical protein
MHERARPVQKSALFLLRARNAEFRIKDHPAEERPSLGCDGLYHDRVQSG